MISSKIRNFSDTKNHECSINAAEYLIEQGKINLDIERLLKELLENAKNIVEKVEIALSEL